MSALSTYTITGPATSGHVRGAGLLDFLASAILAMIAFPQPIARAAITGAGLPVGVFVALIFAIIFAVYWAYLMLSAMAWGRSVGMYLLDLGLDAPRRLTFAAAAGWAIGWVLAALPAMLGITAAFDPEHGLPARLGRTATRSTREQRSPDA